MAMITTLTSHLLDIVSFFSMLLIVPMVWFRFFGDGLQFSGVCGFSICSEHTKTLSELGSIGSLEYQDYGP